MPEPADNIDLVRHVDAPSDSFFVAKIEAAPIQPAELAVWVRCPYPMLSCGFSHTTPLLTPGAFNRMPQNSGFGRTPAGAYTFSGNVVLEALRVVNQACVPTSPHFKTR